MKEKNLLQSEIIKFDIGDSIKTIINYAEGVKSMKLRSAFIKLRGFAFKKTEFGNYIRSLETKNKEQLAKDNQKFEEEIKEKDKEILDSKKSLEKAKEMDKVVQKKYKKMEEKDREFINSIKKLEVNRLIERIYVN